MVHMIVGMTCLNGTFHSTMKPQNIVNILDMKTPHIANTISVPFLVYNFKTKKSN